MVIFKYSVTDGTILDIPVSATILCAREQRERIIVWVQTLKETPTVPVRFRVYDTGAAEPHFDGSKQRYIGTAFLFDGEIVKHVYAENLG